MMVREDDQTGARPGALRSTYFMIRIQRPAAQETGPLNGIVERLGTGEKQQFGSEEELLTLLRCWPADPANMQPHGGLSKPPAAESARVSDPTLVRPVSEGDPR